MGFFLYFLREITTSRQAIIFLRSSCLNETDETFFTDQVQIFLIKNSARSFKIESFLLNFYAFFVFI